MRSSSEDSSATLLAPALPPRRQLRPRIHRLRGVLAFAFALTCTRAGAAPGDIVRILPSPNPLEFRPFFGAVVVPYKGNLLIGAPFSDQGNTDAGVAFLVDIESGEVIRVYLNPTPRAQEHFASSIAVSGDRILIGAPNAFSEDPERTSDQEGIAYVFDGESGELLLTIGNPDGTNRNGFGSSVAILDQRLAVGAPFNDLGHTRSGGVYLFDAGTGSLSVVLKKAVPTEDHFGRTLLASGGDQVVVGATFDESSGVHRGAAYLFDAAGGQPVASYFHPLPRESRAFGSAMAGLGTDILIGDPGDNLAITEGGAVFLFGKDGELARTFRPPDPVELAQFGVSVAGAGDHVLVGASGDRNQNGQPVGRAYLFNGRTGGLLLRLEPPGSAGEDGFGSSVAFVGAFLAVGAPLYDGGKGAVFLIEGDDGTLDPCKPAASSPDDPGLADCNLNGAADRCDIDTGASADCDLNGTPDECQLPAHDCNENGLMDLCEVLDGASDCDVDGRPDECQAAEDCNGNGVPDACDVSASADLGAPRGYPAGMGSHESLAVDLDGNGFPDLVVGTSSISEVAVLEYRGGRNFAAPRFADVGGEGPQRLVAADLDGDGQVDIATSNHFSDSVSVLPGTGDFPFGSLASYPVGANPRNLLAADLDGDRDLDMAVASPSSGISLLFNLGNGLFGPAVTIEQGMSPAYVEAGDMDGDLDIDLISANTDMAKVTVLLNRGDGEFMTRNEYAARGLPTAVKAADLDRDGDLDLVLTSRGGQGVQVLRNRGDGVLGEFETFTGPNAEDLEVVDVDGDADLDIALGTLWLLRNRGDGTFDSSFLPQNAFQLPFLGAADIDRDGRIDFFWQDGSLVDVLWGTGSEVPAMEVLRVGRGDRDPWTTVVEDFNGDGEMDAAVAARGNRISIFDQREGVFEERLLRFQTTVNFPLLLGADLNADGSPDLLALYTTLEVLLNDGRGEFESAMILETDRKTASARVADLDGDGDLDIVSANPESDTARGTVSVLLNDGRAIFSPPLNLEVDGEPLDVEALDLDGDGKVDIISANREPPMLSIFLQTAPGTFAGETKERMDEIGRDVRPSRAVLSGGDFDLDGDQDLALGFSSEAALYLLFNDGTGRFPERRAIEGPEAPIVILPADLDRDGDLDLAVSGLEGNSVVYFTNDGSGRFILRSRIAIGGSPVGLTTADMNGDDLADLLVCDISAKTVSIIHGALIPPFSLDVDGDKVPDECPLSRPAFHRGDANGDGGVDISDGHCILSHLFTGGSAPACREAADANNDGNLDCTDSIVILGYLFLGSSPPVEPGPPPAPCGPDPDAPGGPADLGCDSYDPCVPAER